MRQTGQSQIDHKLKGTRSNSEAKQILTVVI